MEIELDSLTARYTLVLENGHRYTHDSVPLSFVRDHLLLRHCAALLVHDIGYIGPGFDEDGELVTITVFPDAVVSIVSNDTEVALNERTAD